MNIYEELATILRSDMTSKGYTVRADASTDEIVDKYECRQSADPEGASRFLYSLLNLWSRLIDRVDTKN